MFLIRNPNSRISDPYGFIAPAGEASHILYTGVWQTDRLVLVESGSVDLQERIQAQAPSTDLAFMVKRLKLGDNSVLTQKQPLYGDFTQLPVDGSQLVNTLLHAEYAFNQLPVDERKKHGYDYRSWMSSIFEPVVQSTAKSADPSAAKSAVRSADKPDDKPDAEKTVSRETS